MEPVGISMVNVRRKNPTLGQYVGSIPRFTRCWAEERSYVNAQYQIDKLGNYCYSPIRVISSDEEKTANKRLP